MSPKTITDEGRQAVVEQWLRSIRDGWGLSRSAQAHMIGVSPTALRNWENGRTLSQASAERIGRWLMDFRRWYATVEDWVLKEVESGELVHVTVASQQLAMSYGTILEKCHSGVLRCYNLGPLGLYVHREELAHIHAHRQS